MAFLNPYPTRAVQALIIQSLIAEHGRPDWPRPDGRQTKAFYPLSPHDFIFAVTAEESGLQEPFRSHPVRRLP
jgi:cell division protein FtsW (lipid II flippase)